MTNVNIVKKLSITSQLKPLASSLAILIKEYERIIVEISKSLPTIERQIDDNVMEARELLNFIFSNESPDNNIASSYGVKHEIERFHSQLDIALETLKETEAMDKLIFSDIINSIDISTSTLKKMEEIYNISENLKVFAINSIIYSQKAGTNGKGYQIISGEFIRMSEDIAKGTNNINKLGQEMDSQISTLLNLLKEHEDFTSTHIEAISIDSKMLVNSTNSSVQNFSIILNDLLSRIEKCKDPTAQIMTELQKQDIIQQQLEHLMEAMNDILIIIDKHSFQLGSETEITNNEDARQEYLSLYTLLNFLVVSTEKQIRRISSELIGMIDAMESLFTNMKTSIIDIDQDKDCFSRLVLADKNDKDNASVVNQIFQKPADMIKTVVNSIKFGMDQKKMIIDCFMIIENMILEEKESTQAFIPIIETINNLLVLARIEQARYTLNISNFSQSDFPELSKIVENVEQSHALVEHNLQTSINTFDSQKEKHNEMKEKLDNSLVILGKTENIFIENFESVMNITSELFNDINQYVDLFKMLRGLTDDMVAKIDICSDIHDNVDQQLEAFGGPISLEDCLFKDLIIQKIVDKCTVDTERITLNHEFTEFEIEGSSGNSITLF
ncbi:MAG: hypothetical protein JEZ04_22230 [Spirochaetales bacterium]|nr:hypothetical protein [Spirochaetales bacterium]